MISNSSTQARVSPKPDLVTPFSKMIREKTVRKPTLKKSFKWNIASLNVENLRSADKFLVLIDYMISENIHVLCIQETHTVMIDSFIKNDFTFYLSGSPEDKNAGVGFIISPLVKHFVSAFIAHSPRIASVRLHTSPRPIKLF